MLTSRDTTKVHVSFRKGIKAWVGEEVLYNMDPAKTGLRECLIVGFSSYAKQLLTAQILVKEGGRYTTAWSDVPLHLLFHHAQRPDNPLGPLDVVYHDCPDENITMTYFPNYDKGTCWSYFKNRQEWLAGRYLTTIDWYKDNLSAHFVRLKNGQFALVPNHKIQFNGKPNTAPAGLPGYKKLRQTWSAQP